MKNIRKLQLFLIFILSFYFIGCFDSHRSHFSRLLITDDDVEVTDLPPEIKEFYQYRYDLRVRVATAALNDEDGIDSAGNPIDREAAQQRIIQAETLLTCYTKYIDAGGVAIIGNHYVRDEQFYAAREIVLLMTSKRPELREHLSFRKEYPFRMIIKNTEEPVDSEFNSEYGVSIGVNTIPEQPNKWALGWCSGTFCVASIYWDAVYPPNRDGKIDMHLNIFIHEFAHAIHQSIEELDPTFNDRLLEAYEHAKEPHASGEPANSLWNGSDPDSESFNRAYALTNYSEYWAETVKNWFYDKPSVNDVTFKLFEYDALLLPLIEEWFPKIYLRPLDEFERPREWNWGERPN